MPKTIKINAKAIKEIFEVFGMPDRMEFFYENGYNPNQLELLDNLKFS